MLLRRSTPFPTFNALDTGTGSSPLRGSLPDPLRQYLLRALVLLSEGLTLAEEILPVDFFCFERCRIFGTVQLGVLIVKPWEGE